MRRGSGCFGHSAGHKGDVPYPHRIRLFCTAQSTRVSYSTISTYMSAVRMFHLERGHPDPTADIALLLQGIKRRNQPKLNSRKPISAAILRQLRPALDSISPTSYHSKLYWAAFTLAFYGFLRVGEYTSRTRSKVSPSTLRRIDLTLQTTTITIHLPQSKTSQYCSPPPILVASNGTDTFWDVGGHPPKPHYLSSKTGHSSPPSSFPPN